MNRHLTYRPQTAQIPADSFRGGSCDTRDPRRHVSPAHPILNSSFLILNWSYTFSAKEKDVETGLSYFGSRYYSSDLSVWLSVDPMASKYPSLSPYTYCADKPVKLVDPNGEDWYEKDGKMYYTTQYTSKEAFEKSGINGIYKGKFFAENGKYYSLFGNEMDETSKQCELTKKLMKHLTNMLLIKKDADNQEGLILNYKIQIIPISMVFIPMTIDLAQLTRTFMIIIMIQMPI